jgi:hypothetical protein
VGYVSAVSPVAHIPSYKDLLWPTLRTVREIGDSGRLIVEIAGHELLCAELAFRGGTCLHKLHLPQPLRYSEDLDYVRSTHSGIKPYLTALRNGLP